MTLLALVLGIFTVWAHAQDEWEATRSMAESQHEIVIMLIEKGEFDKAVEEARKIFYLPFPDGKDELLVTAARQVADALGHHDKHDLAGHVLDEALLVVTLPKQQAALYKEKGYHLKKLGKTDEAMACYRKALELEQKKK